MAELVSVSGGARAPSQLFMENTGLLFQISPPQRRFKWKKQQVDQLWRDIEAAYSEGRPSYFLGPLILVRHEEGDNEEYSVIDGQQRLATISMLLAILRDECEHHDGLKGRANVIHRLICRVDYDGNRSGPLVVTLQSPDNQIYMSLVEERGSTATSRLGTGRLEAALKALRGHITDFLESENKEERLRKFSDYVLDQIKLLPLQVESEAEGYLVFDTTNTRGLGLSTSEALKARLAAIARSETVLSDQMMEQWTNVAIKLENANLKIDAMDDYLHAIWCSQQGYTTKSRLDRSIGEKLTDTQKLRQFIDELNQYCDSYLAVVASPVPTNKDSLNQDLRDLRRLNVQATPFLTMVHFHSRHHFEEAVNLVVSLQIRNVTIGNHRTNEHEKNWPKWAIMVRKSQGDEAFAEIRHAMDPDEDFLNSMRQATVSSPQTARHLLRRLEPGKGISPADVDVEHVLPKSVVDKLIKGDEIKGNNLAWITALGYDVPESRRERKQLGEKLGSILNRLGNLALLDNKDNRGARNSAFSKKKGFYEKQGLLLTKRLTKFDQWTEKEISTRQNELAESALLVWPKNSTS